MTPDTHKLNPSFRASIRRLRQAITRRTIPATNGTLYDPFFIVGSGRSGTTLLRRILCTSPDIHISPELNIAKMIRVYNNQCKHQWREFVYISLADVEFSADKQFRYSFSDTARQLLTLPKKERSLASIIDAISHHDAREKGIEFTRWGNKMPYNVSCMDEILHMFPDARFVHLLRDGCDVVQSFIHYGIYTDYEKAANAWVRAARYVEQFAHTDRLYSLRYEDLVGTPERYIQEVCDFLDIPFTPEMLESNEKSKAATTEEASKPNQENLHKPISTVSIGKGRTAMPQEQREKIAPIMDPWLIKLGYKACLDND